MEFNVQEFPDWPLAYIRVAGFYEERGNKDKALENCRKALELDPNNPSATAMLERLESPDKQISGFESREIGTFGGFFELAEAHARLGNQAQAIQSCKKSLELNPDFAEALDLLKKLERQ